MTDDWLNVFANLAFAALSCHPRNQYEESVIGGKAVIQGAIPNSLQCAAID
jgi:hypothetical protein